MSLLSMLIEEWKYKNMLMSEIAVLINSVIHKVAWIGCNWIPPHYHQADSDEVPMIPNWWNERMTRDIIYTHRTTELKNKEL